METKDLQEKYFKEAQQYDKILRENMEAALPGIIESVLHIHAVHSEELPDTLQHTKEREPDVLKKITDETGNTFVLQVEYQATNEANMPFRMADYWVMLLRNYRLPVKQHVIYIGHEKLTMGNVLRDGDNFFTYNLVNISAIDYKVFLRGETVDEKMLAILGNYGADTAETAITDIISDVLQNTTGLLEKERRKNQLRVLVRLRNLAPLNIEDMLAKVADLFKMEDDMLYIAGERKGEKKGIEKGIEKGMERGRLEEKVLMVTNMLRKGRFAVEEIAEIAEVSVDFVNQIKSSL